MHAGSSGGEGRGVERIEGNNTGISVVELSTLVAQLAPIRP